jgi:hypothetical protein
MTTSRKNQPSYDGLRVPRSRNEGDIVTVDLEKFDAPAKALFADYVQVDKTRDGVLIVFGKTGVVLRNVVEVSMPYTPFYSQLYRSLVTLLPGESTPFRDTAREMLKHYEYEEINRIEPLPFSEGSAIRANACFVVAHADDAALDFFYIDAPTLAAVTRTGKLPGRVVGIIRVIVSLPVLVFFVERCIAVAEQLRRELPNLVRNALPEGTE